MDKSFVKNAIIIPLVAGVILSLAFFLYLRANIDQFIPVYKDTVFAYHDTQANTETMVDKTERETLRANDCIGYLNTDAVLPVLYDGDYTNLSRAVSFLPQSATPKENGYIYCETIGRVMTDIGKNTPVTFQSIFGDCEYRFLEEKTFDSEYSLLSYAPDTEKALIIYSRKGGEVGLTSQYKALVFEEVDA